MGDSSLKYFQINLPNFSVASEPMQLNVLLRTLCQFNFERIVWKRCATCDLGVSFVARL